jgi:hypothetical protein
LIIILLTSKESICSISTSRYTIWNKLTLQGRIGLEGKEMTGMLTEPGALKLLIEARVEELRAARVGRSSRMRLPRPN